MQREVTAVQRRDAPERAARHASIRAWRVAAAGGFTLVEVFTAIVIAGLAIGAAVKLFQRGFESQARAAEFTQAAHFARAEVARLQALGFPRGLAELRRTSEFRPLSAASEATAPFRWRGEIVNLSEPMAVVDFAVHIVWPWPEKRYELTFRSALAER